jgi:hypothetical protein
MGLTQTILERMENNLLKYYGRVLGMRDKRWPQGILTWSPEGRKRHAMKWEREVKSDQAEEYNT